MNLPTIYVVMGNDYPAATFTTEALAEEYCERRREEEKRRRVREGENYDPGIYWRVYPFQLRDSLPTDRTVW